MADQEGDGSVWQELQVLQSIYLEELDVCQEDGVLLKIALHPATGADMERQYVCLTLQLALPPKYPDEPPEISVSNPRGLCDEQIHSIIGTLRGMAGQAAGGPVLYELIEKGKEMLTASNIPGGHCVICLYGFQEGDCLTKTPCYHYFHSHCLGRYARHCQERGLETEPAVLCPVCREHLTCDVNKLQEAPPPQQTEERYVPDAHALQRERELQQIYERQRASGGIIDVEAERKRFFISIQETPAIDHTIAASEETSQTTEERGQTSSAEASPLSLPSKQQQHGANIGGHRARAQAGPVSRVHHDGQCWRESRGWGGRTRWRDDGHRHVQARGRGKTRICHTNEAVRTPLQGPPENSLEERHGA